MNATKELTVDEAIAELRAAESAGRAAVLKLLASGFYKRAPLVPGGVEPRVKIEAMRIRDKFNLTMDELVFGRNRS